jgi:phosphoribosylformimino-5-aminoimidazole carboxamide ribotide isomerase
MIVMDIIPAVDLKSGKCVRLVQGRDDATTVYSDDPITVARGWVGEGARKLHVVNLDGAFGRESRNLEVLGEICRSIDVVVQFGGGLRTLEAMNEAFGAGAAKIVLGTVAIEDPGLLDAALAQFGAERTIVALDAVEGRVATRGWTVVSDRAVVDVAREILNAGVREILYTDIKRDGMLSGPDISTLGDLASTGLSVIASGGVSSADDIRAIAALRSSSISGVIVGKALYEGRVTFRELMEAR